MKGYCNCRKEIDEVEYTQFGMCAECYMKSKTSNIKHPRLKVRKGNTDFFYVCNTLEWNYYLDRYYPKATLTMEVVHIPIGLTMGIK